MAPLTPSDPQRLGSYWLAGRLGAGGQGVVYEAYGEAGERVAVKVPRLDDPGSRSRLAKEAAAAQRVASFCTARVIEAATDVAQPYIVSTFVPGQNLRQMITAKGAFDGDALRRLGIGVATALTAIHQAGVVHRDLKPDNIILGPDGPRVIDFGVARELGPTTTGPVMGTPNYMAPEVLSGRGATPAADVWAWGLVVLFAAEGRDAVEAREPMATVTSVLDFTPDVSGLPEPLQGLVVAALARDPADRPPARSLLMGLLGDSDDPLSDGGTQAAPLTGEADQDLGTIAEELYHELSESERATAAQVFLRMLSGDETIRQVPRAELAGAEPVLSLYGAAGLIIETESACTLAQPGLVHAWPRMRQWVADNRTGLPIHRRLTEAALVWDGHGRRAGDLLHGSVLDTTLRWAATERRDVTLMGLEKDFLDSAAKLTRRRARRRGALVIVLTVLLVAALGGIGLAEYRRTTVDRQRDDALAASLAQRAADLREDNPKLAALLSVAALRLAPEQPEPRAALNDALSQRITDTFADPDAGPDSVYATSADGRVLAAVLEGKARIWDVRAHRLIGTISRVGRTVVNAALSPDGRTLALQDAKGVRIWDTATGAPSGDRFARGGDPEIGTSFAFDASGKLLAVPEQAGGRSWWDVDGRTRLRTPSGRHLDAVSAGRSLGVVASAGVGRADLWDLRKGERRKAAWLPLKDRITDVAFSADGRLLAYSEEVRDAEENRVVVRDLTGRVLLRETVDSGFGRLLAFGFGDAYLADWDLDGLLVVRRVKDGWPIVEMRLPVGPAQVRFDAADRVIRVQTRSGTVQTLDLSAAFQPPVASWPPGPVALGPGGTVMAGYSDGLVRLWDVAAARPIGSPIPWGTKAWAEPVTFSADGSRVAVGGQLKGRSAAVVIDAASARVLGTAVSEKGGGVSSLAFSPDAAVLAMAPVNQGGETRPVELHDLRSGAVVKTGVVGGAVLTFRPDGRMLIAGAVDGLIDPSTGATLPRPSRLGKLPGPFSYSPDGRLLAVGGEERITLWSADLSGHLDDFPAVRDGRPVAVAWSPDGRTLASYSLGDRIRLWDVGSRQPLGTVADGLVDGDLADAVFAFAPDGRTLTVATAEGAVRHLPLDAGRVEAAVCARVGRSLTRQEWDRYLPGVARFPVC